MIVTGNHTGRLVTMALLVLTVVAAAGCYQGKPSSKPPIHPNPNMDNQPKYLPQSTSEFFDDGAAMRSLVTGTVARGHLNEDVVFYTGKTESGNFVKTNPATVDRQFLLRGQKEYDIYCSPCHSRIGDGRGIMVKYNYVPPPTFHVDRLRDIEDGYIYDVITNGIRNMPSYRHQIKVEDRWAIVAYLRALQRSQNATADDVPAAMLERIK